MGGVGRDVGMVKILPLVCHADTVHGNTRSGIGAGGKGDDLLQPTVSETRIKRGVGGFGSMAVSSVRQIKPPADLHAGGKRVRGEGFHQAGRVDESAV